MPNFLEQLVAEWYEYNGYFVRRNVNVGKLPEGGYTSELDVVAFHPETKHVVHVEPSMDADSWEQREKRYAVKFSAGKQFIPTLFKGIHDLSEVEHIAIFVFGSAKKRSEIGGGRGLSIKDFMNQIYKEIPKNVMKQVVPEQFTILRSMQSAASFWTKPAKGS